MPRHLVSTDISNPDLLKRPVPRSPDKMDLALKHAEMICQAQGGRLTPNRRKVLETLYLQTKPIGAYELADMLAPAGRRLAPITVYRALDFLIEHGLTHRLASRNAYMARPDNHGTQETSAFLVCETCGTAEIVSSSELASSLAKLAKQEGFRPGDNILEIVGQCPECQNGAH